MANPAAEDDVLQDSEESHFQPIQQPPPRHSTSVAPLPDLVELQRKDPQFWARLTARLLGHSFKPTSDVQLDGGFNVQNEEDSDPRAKDRNNDEAENSADEEPPPLLAVSDDEDYGYNIGFDREELEGIYSTWQEWAIRLHSQMSQSDGGVFPPPELDETLDEDRHTRSQDESPPSSSS